MLRRNIGFTLIPSQLRAGVTRRDPTPERTMNAARLACAATIAALAFAAPLTSQAQTFAHPALGRTAAAPVSIDPNTFIVAHPARLALRAGHANFAHPADVLGHLPAPFDTNHFLVQPPSAVRWVAAPAAPLAVTAAR